MSKYLHQRLNNVPQIILNAKDRKSGRNIPRTVWIVHKGNILYLLPNYGSGTVVIELPRKSNVENLGRWGRNACKRKPVADNESCRHFE
jgi:hypothetical protein